MRSNHLLDFTYFVVSFWAALLLSGFCSGDLPYTDSWMIQLKRDLKKFVH